MYFNCLKCYNEGTIFEFLKVTHVLCCSAEKVFFEDHMKYFRVSVQSNGQMNWHPAGIYRTTCAISVTYFPYDTQVRRCNLQWTFLSKILHIFTGIC